MNANPLATIITKRKADSASELEVPTWEDELKTLFGKTEDEVLDWAAVHDVDLDPSYEVAEYDHLVGTVIAVRDLGDDQVAITIGVVAEAVDVDAQIAAIGAAPTEVLPPVDVSDVDDTQLTADTDYFAGVAAHNESVADGSWLQQIEDRQDALPAPVEPIDEPATDDAPPLVAAASPKQSRNKKKMVPILLAAAFAFTAVMLLLGSSHSAKSPQTARAHAAPVTAAVAAPALAAARPAKKPVARHHAKKASRHHRRHKRHGASTPSTTPQAAPRPVAPQTNYPAPSQGGGCGSRSSEFSFEC